MECAGALEGDLSGVFDGGAFALGPTRQHLSTTRAADDGKRPLRRWTFQLTRAFVIVKG